MSEALLQQAIADAGLDNAFAVLDLSSLVAHIERAGAESSLHDGSFSKFLQAIVSLNTLPATWQKLADLDWNDEEISGLIASGLLAEGGSTLTSAVNAGALAIAEFNEFANFPNQEVTIFYYTKAAKGLAAWFQGKLAMPKISRNAYSTE